MRTLMLFPALVAAAGLLPAIAQAQAAGPLQVYGAWHCGSDLCDWHTVRTVAEFDSKNHWLIDRGDAAHTPSVNLVVLSFVNPLTLLNAPADNPLAGIPAGMTQDIVNYFTKNTSGGKALPVRVMLSIGGITYTKDWNQALAKDPTTLGQRAAAVAKALGVGIEIDYEEANSPNIAGLQAFITAYRNQLPYDASGTVPEARLTIDLAAGDRWLIGITQKATRDWLNPANPVLDYANAMVPARQPKSAADAISNWQEHIDGKPQYAPPIPPLAPAKFTGSLWLVGSKPIPECTTFGSSLQNSTGSYVRQVVGTVGSTPGMLGYMFWAAECEGSRTVCTTPKYKTCEGGVGVGATTYSVPIPMPPLRQQ